MPIATLPDASEAASADAIRELVESDESKGLEFKRVSGKMVGKALETVCAFANAGGGVLVLGMADLKEHKGNARLFGVGENREAVDELQRKLVTEFQPPLEAVDFQRLHCAVHNGPDKGKGPLVDQIDAAVRAVLDELAQGLTLSSSGFKTSHAYPERVIKEAIVNAVIHRDYRLNRDIFIRVFDDRIEVESPGVFPGNITPATISRAGSKARNPLVAINLREFPQPPNIDASEGVKMMFAEMAQAMLYPPQYRENLDAAVESVAVTLLNLQRPTAWDEVSDWIDRNGSIANAEVCRIAKVDTLKASKMLMSWREQGLLVGVKGRGKRNMAYTKPSGAGEQVQLLSGLEDNNLL